FHVVAVLAVDNRNPRQSGGNYAEHQSSPTVGVHDLHLFRAKQPRQARNPTPVDAGSLARQQVNTDIRPFQALRITLKVVECADGQAEVGGGALDNLDNAVLQPAAGSAHAEHVHHVNRLIHSRTI